MDLPQYFKNISLLSIFPMDSRAYGLYRPEVGNNLQTSPQDLASKRAQDPVKMD